MTNTAFDELGLVEFAIIEFPAGTPNVAGEMVDELVDVGTIRVIDILILVSDEHGEIDAIECSDLDDLGPMQTLGAELAELLAEHDVMNLAAAMDPGSTAGVIIFENLWVAPFAWAVRHSGRRLIADGRIPIQAIITSIEADHTLETVGD